MGHGLVVDHEIKQHVLSLQDVGNAAQEPGVQAVGVDGQGHGRDVAVLPRGQLLKE